MLRRRRNARRAYSCPAHACRKSDIGVEAFEFGAEPEVGSAFFFCGKSFSFEIEIEFGTEIQIGFLIESEVDIEDLP